jgi:hypothetical protein
LLFAWLTLSPEDGGSTFVENTSKWLHDVTSQITALFCVVCLHTKFWSESLNGRDQLEDPSIDGSLWNIGTGLMEIGCEVMV